MNKVYVYGDYFTDDREFAIRWAAQTGNQPEVKRRYVPEPEPVKYPVTITRKAALLVKSSTWVTAVSNAEANEDYSNFYNQHYNVIGGFSPSYKRKSQDGNLMLVCVNVNMSIAQDRSVVATGADRLDQMKANNAIVDWYWLQLTEEEQEAGVQSIFNYIQTNTENWNGTEIL